MATKKTKPTQAVLNRLIKDWARKESKARVSEDWSESDAVVLEEDLRDDAMSFVDDGGGGCEMPFCCAYNVIGDFSESKDYPPSVYEAAVILHLRDAFVGPTLATTVPKQKQTIRILEALGFTALQTITNPRTKNRVTLWYADL